MKDKVSIVQCNDYSNVKNAIVESLSLIGGINKLVSPGNKVLLKPNLLAIKRPEAAVTTHPSIVTAMCELIKEAGAFPIVGDASGITRPDPTATAEALKLSGIEEAALKAGAQVINFEIDDFKKVDIQNSKEFSSLHIAKAIIDADVIISLPKLKTHELTLYTGAVKNFFGVIPRKERKAAHFLARPDRFSDAVIDIYSFVKPHLAIMDGVVGMEGDGPSAGTPIYVGVIMASYDCVSLDIVASELVGFNPMDIPTNKAALDRGFGTVHPEVVGTALSKVKVNFKKPTGGIAALIPAVIRGPLLKQFTVRPFINTTMCVLCKACVLNCSVNAIEETDGALKIDDKKCIQCFCCRELCPEHAVEAKKSFLLELMTKIKK